MLSSKELSAQGLSAKILPAKALPATALTFSWCVSLSFQHFHKTLSLLAPMPCNLAGSFEAVLSKPFLGSTIPLCPQSTTAVPTTIPATVQNSTLAYRHTAMISIRASCNLAPERIGSAQQPRLGSTPHNLSRVCNRSVIDTRGQPAQITILTLLKIVLRLLYAQLGSIFSQVCIGQWFMQPRSEMF